MNNPLDNFMPGEDPINDSGAQRLIAGDEMIEALKSEIRQLELERVSAKETLERRDLEIQRLQQETENERKQASQAASILEAEIEGLKQHVSKTAIQMAKIVTIRECEYALQTVFDSVIAPTSAPSLRRGVGIGNALRGETIPAEIYGRLDSETQRAVDKAIYEANKKV